MKAIFHVQKLLTLHYKKIVGDIAMKKVMILFNETSGKNNGKEIAENFVEYAKNKGFETTEFFLEQVGPDIDGQKNVNKAEKEQVDTVIMIGGDGTINHNVNDFKKILSKVNVGLLPGGTVNNLARVLGIPLKFEKAADVILEGNTQAVDYGTVNEKVIVSTLTIGILADTAVRITQKEKQKYGKIIFVKNFFKLLFKKKRYFIEVQTEKETWRGKTQLVTVNMTNSVGGYTNFDSSAAPDDGLFHLSILPKLHFYKIILYLPKIILGKISEISELKYITAKEMKIASSQKKKIGTRVDGDPCDDLPIKMKVINNGLTVFVPKKEKK